MSWSSSYYTTADEIAWIRELGAKGNRAALRNLKEVAPYRTWGTLDGAAVVAAIAEELAR